MPNPLSSLPSKKSYNFDDRVYEKRPNQIGAAMKIVVASAEADQWPGNILIELSPENAPRLAEVLNGLENDAKKTAAFEAICSVLLSPDLREVLDKVFKRYRSASKLRNPFAHHRYGVTNDDPDALLLVDPRNELIDRAQRVMLEARKPAGDDPAKIQEWLHGYTQTCSNQGRKSIMVYSHAELGRILKEVKGTTALLVTFWQISAKKLPPEITSRQLIGLKQSLGMQG